MLLATGIYAYLTWRLAKAASESVGQAERAAAAAERSAAVAEAALPIKFSAVYMDTALGRHINLWNRGARVMLYGVRLDLWMFFHEGQRQVIRSVELKEIDGEPFPILIHREEGLTFPAPNDVPVDTDKPFAGDLTIRYSLVTDAIPRTVACTMKLVETDEVDIWLQASREGRGLQHGETE